MNKKQATMVIVPVSLLMGVYAQIFFGDVLPFWKAYLLSLGILAGSLLLTNVLIRYVKLYEKLGDSNEEH